MITTTPPTPQRCCIACGHTYPDWQFGKDKTRKDGLKPRCKPCERAHIKGFGKYIKKQPNPALVPPRSSKTDGIYRPADERIFYRNDGLKHIKSRGTLC